MAVNQTSMRRIALPFFLLASSAVPTAANASVTFYSSLSSYQANTNTTTVLDLNSLAPINSFVSYGSPGSVDLGPVTVGTTGPLFAQNNNLWGQGGYLSAQQLTGATVTFTFDNPLTAFAFNYAAGAPFTITVGGQSTTLAGGTYPPFIMSFLGITSDTPFSTLSFTMSGNGVDMDNLRLGALAAVPEPATWALMLLGFGMIGSVMRRRRACQIPQIA